MREAMATLPVAMEMEGMGISLALANLVLEAFRKSH